MWDTKLWTGKGCGEQDCQCQGGLEVIRKAESSLSPSALLCSLEAEETPAASAYTVTPTAALTQRGRIWVICALWPNLAFTDLTSFFPAVLSEKCFHEGNLHVDYIWGKQNLWPNCLLSYKRERQRMKSYRTDSETLRRKWNPVLKQASFLNFVCMRNRHVCFSIPNVRRGKKIWTYCYPYISIALWMA